MPKRKLDKDSAAWDFLEEITPTRRSKLRKLDHQDVTINSSTVRLPVPRPLDAIVRTGESRAARQMLISSCDEIDQLAVRFTFLSLEIKSPFKAPRAGFPKFSLLPTEIRLMIWKYARPVPRIVKLSRSNQQGICNSRIGCSLIHLVALGCSSDHLISGVPIPNLLHICSESRAIALKWYCLRFQPPCGHGGTFIDSEIDYLYYGPEQRKFLISPNSAVPRWGWAKDRNRWVKDRQSIPNIVVRCTGDSESWDLMTLMQTSVWCNEFAKQILLVFYWDIEERTMVSDLKPLLVQSCTSPRHPELVNNRDSKVVFAAWLKDARKLLPWWKRFNPERVEPHHVFGTANQLQNFGFKREFFQDKKVDFSFQSAAIAH